MIQAAEYSIGELCEMKKGSSPTMKTPAGDYPLVVTAEFRRTSDTYQFDTEAVCVPLVSSTGHGNAALHRVHYQGGKFALANILVALIPRDPRVCNAKYLYYLFQAQKDYVLVPLMQGTANVSLKVQDIAKVIVSLPPLDEQCRIVAKIEALASKVDEVKRLRAEILTDAQSMLRGSFQEVTEGAGYRSMSEVAPIIRRKVEIDMDSEYPELGVRSFHKGTFSKCTSLGMDIAHKKMFHIEPGDLIFSNIMAWEGAIAVARPEDEGRIGVHRFITCVPEMEVATSGFLGFYFQTGEGFQKIVEASPATIARNRTLGIKKLEKIEVPVPDYEKQLWFDSLLAEVAAIQQAQNENQTELDALLPAILDNAFRGEL